MQRVLCLWLPNWPIQRLIVEQPPLKRTRIVLWHQDSRRGQLISAASPLAHRDGVQVGMPLSEASSVMRAVIASQQPNTTKASESQTNHGIPGSTKKVLNSRHPRQQSRTLAKKLNELQKDKSQTSQPIPPYSAAPASTRSPRASQKHTAVAQPASNAPTSLPANFAADRNGLQQLAISCQTLAPIVGLETVEYPSSIFLDVTNLSPLYGSEPALLKQVIKHFRQAGYLVRAAIADTISVAWGLAHYAQDPSSIAPQHSKLETLEFLPIQSLRLKEATCETLRQLGLNHVGQLLELPRASLTARFGDEINLRLDQATGQVREVFEVIHTPTEYVAEELLEWPIKDIATTLVIIQRLLEKLCQNLQSDACGALQWRIRLSRQESSPLLLDIKLFQPTTTAEHVMQLVEMQLDNHPEFRQLSPRKKNYLSRQSPVTEIHVAVTNCVQLAERQRKLFDDEPSLNRIALAQLINRLSSRLGQDQVTRPVLQASAQPEFSFQLKPLVESKRSPSKTKARKKSHYIMARPLRLLNPAIELQPVSTGQSFPHSFQKPDRSTFQIQRHWGPERIETGWWRGHTVCRDYWRIETDRGSQLWIYRDRRTGQWKLHGEF